MPRYFVHLCDRSVSVFDDEGRDFPDENAAFDHAVWCIRDVVSNSILSDQPVSLASYMTIESSDSIELRRVYFHEVIKFLNDDTVLSDG